MFVELMQFFFVMFGKTLTFIFNIELQPGLYLWHFVIFGILFGFVIQYVWNTVIDKEGGK